MVSSNISRVIAVAVGLGFFALMPARALAHCDGLDGPVVKAAPPRKCVSGNKTKRSSVRLTSIRPSKARSATMLPPTPLRPHSRSLTKKATVLEVKL